MFFGMDFQSAMETFAEAWVAASAGAQQQALALTRPKSPKKESSVPVSPSNGREVEMSSPKVHLSSSSSSIVSDHPNPAALIGGENLNLCSASATNGGGSSSNRSSTPQQQQQQQLHHHQHHHPAISVSQSLMGANATRSLTPRISVSTSLAENGSGVTSNSNSNIPISSGGGGVANSSSSISGGIQAPPNPSNGSVVGDRGIVPQSPVAAVAAAAAAMQDRKDFDFSKVNAKSLPLHCVVESVSSLQATLNFDARSPWKRRPNIETDS